MSDREFKLAQIQLGQIYLIKMSDMLLKPDGCRINPIRLVGYIRPRVRYIRPRLAAKSLKSDGGWINPTDQIYLTNLTRQGIK
jgi:hypothetical protein